MKDFVVFHKYGIRWIINRDYSEKIIVALETLADLKSIYSGSPQAEETANVTSTTIKSNTVRSVRKIIINEDQELFFKHYKPKGWIDSLKFSIFGSKARREWRNGNEILRRRVYAGQPVAYGEKRRGLIVSDNFLMVKSVDNSVSLKDALINNITGNRERFKNRRLLLKRLSRFIVKLHSKGILHKDLHTGNILVNSQLVLEQGKQADNETRGFSIIDLHDVRCKSRLPQETVLKNLARHLYSLTPYCSRTEIFFVMKEYLMVLGPAFMVKSVTKEVNHRIQGYKHRHMLSRSKRCMKKSSEFTIKSWTEEESSKHYKYKVYYKKKIDKYLIKEAINTHYKTMRVGGEDVIKNIPRISVTKFQTNVNDLQLRTDDLTDNLCTKEYKCPKIFSQIRETIFPPRGERAWRAANGFTTRGIVTPDPIAYIRVKKSGRLNHCMVISEYVEPATPVYLYVVNCLNIDNNIKSKDNAPQVMNGNCSQVLEIANRIARKRYFIESFARSFRNIHKQGIYHADLKGGNILVKEISKCSWKFYYLDLDNVAFGKSVTSKKIKKNLIQLNASLPNDFSFSDRIRFYKYYFHERQLDNRDKLLLKKIIIESIKKKHFWKP